MKEYRVGIIGFGFMGKAHAYGHLNMALYYDPPPCRTRITHVCDNVAAAAEKGAKQVGAENAVTDFRRVTEDPNVDIVHICTPNNFHLEALLSAIAHGKHIYCDKPLVSTVEEAGKVQEALAGFSGTAQMNLEIRFFPSTIRARQLIEEGFIGEPLEFRACYLHSGSSNPEAPLKWKLSRAAGGGVIADLASHIMDMVHWLLGEYEEILAETKIAYPERPSSEDPSKMVPVEAEDCVMMLVRMANGAVGNIEATKLATGTEDEVRFEAHGSRGGLRFNGMFPNYLEVYDVGAPSSPVGGVRGWTRIDTGQRYAKPAGFPGPKFSIGWIRSILASVVNFMDDVVEGRPGNPGLQRGILIQHLIESCRRSAEARAWERAPEKL
jgi:predicted dehydrogenase